MATSLTEKIKAIMGDNPRWHPSEEGGGVAVVIIEQDGKLPCGCASWRKNEPHPGFPLREHYSAASIGPEQFTIVVYKDGKAVHFACGEDVATISL
ncbi:MAG: hypothetical protein AAB561_02460 [Patescibacteria group bacterium]